MNKIKEIKAKYRKYISNIEWDTKTNERKGKLKELNDEQIKYYEEFLSDLNFLDGKRGKVICYCGSLRFIETFKEVEYQSVIAGDIALLPCCMFVDIQREHGEASDYKIKADELHKRKIDICDEVFVLNVNGYIGESTRGEIEYAKKIGKPVKYLEPEAGKYWEVTTHKIQESKTT